LPYYAAAVTAPFDANQPGVILLRDTARRIMRDLQPVAVEIRTRQLLIDEQRELLPGDRTTVPALLANRMIERGHAVRLPPPSKARIWLSNLVRRFVLPAPGAR
jgi:hypothetical protein